MGAKICPCEGQHHWLPVIRFKSLNLNNNSLIRFHPSAQFEPSVDMLWVVHNGSPHSQSAPFIVPPPSSTPLFPFIVGTPPARLQSSNTSLQLGLNNNRPTRPIWPRTSWSHQLLSDSEVLFALTDWCTACCTQLILYWFPWPFTSSAFSSCESSCEWYDVAIIPQIQMICCNSTSAKNCSYIWNIQP